MLARLKSLQATRDILNAKIQQELVRPQPCSLRLQALKRRRLLLKDKIVRMSRMFDNLTNQQLRA